MIGHWPISPHGGMQFLIKVEERLLCVDWLSARIRVQI